MRVLPLTLMLAVLCLTSHGAAQPAANAEARAKELFVAGHAAMDRGDHAEACRLFEESLTALERPSTLLNLGACHQALGRAATALRYWQRGAAALEPGDARHALAKERIAALEALAPRLRIELPAALPAGAVLALDAEPVAPPVLEAGVRLDAGTHRLELEAPGHVATVLTVELADGDDKVVALTLVAAAPPPPPPPPAPPLPAPPPPVMPPPPAAAPDRHALPIWIWPVGAAGIVASGVAIGFAVDYANTVAEQEERCGGDVTECRPEPRGSYDPEADNARKDRDAIAGVVLGIAGGAALLAAVVGAIVGERAPLVSNAGGFGVRF
jgi:hypothetical protein